MPIIRNWVLFLGIVSLVDANGVYPEQRHGRPQLGYRVDEVREVGRDLDVEVVDEDGPCCICIAVL